MDDTEKMIKELLMRWFCPGLDPITILEILMVTASTIGAVYNARGRRVGFYWFTMSNLLWIAYAIAMGRYILLIQFVIYLFISLYGMFHWTGNAPTRDNKDDVHE